MKHSRHFWRGLFFILLITALCGGIALPAGNITARAAPQMQVVASIVISQVYGGGGNAGAPYLNDYVELFNPGNLPVSLNGWSIQYVSATGTGLFSSNVTNLSGTLSPGQYYLVRLASGGSIGSALPTPDSTGTIDLSANNGKVILVNTTTGLACNGSSTPCAASDLASIIDLVGYGTANFFEGTGAAPAASNTTAVLRNSNGCSDTDNNNADFVVGAPAPRNSASPAFPCTAVIDVTSSAADGVYTTGTIIDIAVTFSDIVNVSGSPTLLLETGATNRTAIYLSGTGSDTLTFQYTVLQGDTSRDLDYVATNSLTGGTITDSSGMNVSLKLPNPGAPGSLGANHNIAIDNGLPPTVTVDQASGQADPANATPVNFTIIFSEPIDVSTFTLSSITQNGTANPVTWTITNSGDDMRFTLSATSVTQSNVTLIPSIAAGQVTDLIGTGNLASTSTDNTVTFVIPPTATPTFTPTPTNTSPPVTGSATNVVISEFRTSAGSGAATNEYIEIYNPTANPIDISGWKISASNSSGDIQTRATIPASTILRSGQYYLITHTGYVVINSVSPNLTYGTGIADDGGIALLNASDQIIDEVGMHQNSFYQEGSILSPLSNANRSYERRVGDPGPAGSCVDTNNNANDFASEPPTPHNYSTIRLCNGTSGPSVGNTATNITTDSPDPSVVNGNVIVSVSVTGGSTTPTGRVNITGANTNCTITLSASGTGSCTVKFTSTGIKTITAVYLGDNTHWNSSDTETHTVTTSSGTIRTPTPTRPPTPLPPPPLIGINEFVPRPGHDWNNDGVINTDDEYIELINHGVIDVSLSGYSLDDEVNIGSSPFSLPSITLKPGERRVFYGSETGLLLSDGGDGVRLLKPNGQLGDAYNYSVVRFPDQSYCRLPDNGGLDDWNQNCFPTPGLQNSQSASSVNPPTSGDAENLCPVSDTLPVDFVLAECLPFGNNIYNSAYWDQFGWFDEQYLPESTGKWPVFVD